MPDRDNATTSLTTIFGVTNRDTVCDTFPLNVLQSLYVTSLTVFVLVSVGTPSASLGLRGSPFSSLHQPNKNLENPYIM